MRVEFGAGNIVYKETIRNTVEGVGHFEPLRHYAEDPSGCWSRENPEAECIFCPIAVKMCWIKTGSVRSDTFGRKRTFGVCRADRRSRICRSDSSSGRAHQKHTEGGDVRQATYRAVRQGLKKAEKRTVGAIL